MNSSVSAYQARILEHAAEEHDTVGGLLYFHAARGDGAALTALAPRARANPADRLVLDLLTGAPVEALLAQVDGAADAWTFHALTKAALRVGRVDDALAVMEAALRSLGDDVSCVNLTARYAAYVGSSELAGKLADISLGLAPDQQDILELRNYTAAGLRPRRGPCLEARPGGAPVALYVPAYRIEAYIERVLVGIFAQTHPLAAVYVVDDGTPDDSIRLAERFPVTVLRHGENRGLAAARNTAFHHADVPWLGAADGDVVLERDYVRYAVMELESAPETVAGVGGRLREAHIDTPADLWRATHLAQDPGTARIHPPRFLFGSNTVYNRDAVLAVGGYDGAHRTNGEDADLGRRLLAAGRTFTVAPLAKASHLRRDTNDSVLRTLWGWAQAERAALGDLESFASVLDRMPNGLEQTVSLINGDGAEGARQGLVYLDLLYVFHVACNDLAWCARQGLAPPGAARHVQDTLLATLPELDGRHGGDLEGKVRRDVASLLIDAAPVPPGAEDAVRVEAFLSELRRVYAAIEPDLYRLMEGAP